MSHKELVIDVWRYTLSHTQQPPSASPSVYSKRYIWGNVLAAKVKALLIK